MFFLRNLFFILKNVTFKEVTVLYNVPSLIPLIYIVIYLCYFHMMSFTFRKVDKIFKPILDRDL